MWGCPWDGSEQHLRSWKTELALEPQPPGAGGDLQLQSSQTDLLTRGPFLRGFSDAPERAGRTRARGRSPFARVL